MVRIQHPSNRVSSKQFRLLQLNVNTGNILQSNCQLLHLSGQHSTRFCKLLSKEHIAQRRQMMDTKTNQ